MKKLVLLLTLLLTSSLAADPVITSVSPDEGPVAGGTLVRITGSGFSQVCIVCSPPFGATPEVFFGTTRAESVTFVDPTLLEAVTPAHLPGEVSVTVRQYDGSNPFTLQNAFTFIGQATDAFEPLLFPVFIDPVNGAFGSRFETTARVSSNTFSEPVLLYGVDTTCYTFSPVTHPSDPFFVGGEEVTLLTGCNRSTGRVLWIEKGDRDKLAASLRVTDVTREASSLGVEVPIVHGDEFRDRRLTLLNVPVDPRYRHTLRIYSLSRADVLVTVSVNGFIHRQITLEPGEDVFDPSYVALSEFPALPAGTKSMRVSVNAEPGIPIWALMSVTNNETQAITTVTPQP